MWYFWQMYIYQVWVEMLVRASPMVLSMWPWTLIGWRKVNICWFGSWQWFFSCIFVWFAEAGKKCSKAVQLLEKSLINMICAPCLWLDNHNDLSRWFAISNSHLFPDPVSILWVGFSVFFKNIFAKLPVWPPLMYDWWSSG